MSVRRFVVGIDEETPQDVSAILDYVKERDLSWWHWIDNLWLLVTDEPLITAVSLREDLVKITENKTVMVLQVNPVTWAAYGPEPGEGYSKSISKWVKNTWNKKP